jgi:transcriptional regulator with XRE-family HTH domain
LLRPLLKTLWIRRIVRRVATDRMDLQAKHRAASESVPKVIKTFMRVADVSQQQLADALGMTQTQVSRRLNVPGALSAGELMAMAAFFEVPVESFYKDLPDAVTDLLTAQKRCIAPAAA